MSYVAVDAQSLRHLHCAHAAPLDELFIVEDVQDGEGSRCAEWVSEERPGVEGLPVWVPPRRHVLCIAQARRDWHATAKGLPDADQMWLRLS